MNIHAIERSVATVTACEQLRHRLDDIARKYDVSVTVALRTVDAAREAALADLTGRP